MRLFTMSQIFSPKYNINSQYEISPDVQKKIVNGNAAFIIDMMTYQKITSFSITSLGIQIVNYFFIGKSYLNYDRFIYCAAALTVAFKIKELDHSRLNPIILSYFHCLHKQEKGKIICIAECAILRAIEFNFEYSLPFDFLSSILSNFCNETEDNREKIFYATKSICFDSFRSHAPLIFKPQTIAISAFLISCSQFNFDPSQRISQKLKEKYTPSEKQEESYGRWLEEVSQELSTLITAEDVKDCLYVMNELLYLHYKPKSREIKSFDEFQEIQQKKVERKLENPSTNNLDREKQIQFKN